MATQNQPNQDRLYEILREWALKGQTLTYTELSDEYARRNGGWFEPHGSWDDPLGDINRQLSKSDRPPLSVIVVLKESGEPGGDFWDCADNVPPRPSDGPTRLKVFGDLAARVFEEQWPLWRP